MRGSVAGLLGLLGLASTPASPVRAVATTAADTDFPLRAAAMYETQPSIATCRPGRLSAARRAALLASLNAIRALHRLPPVAYSPSDEPAAQAAALIDAANGTLSHKPPPNWRCYTALGAAGSGTSNLHGGFGRGLDVASEDDILAGWMTERHNLIGDSIGHRRWLLDPFLGAVAFGRVIGPSPTRDRADAAALSLSGQGGAKGRAHGLPAYVAYPHGDYPARYFHPTALLSFAVIASSDPTSSANASVDYANAAITVRRRGGGALAVSRQAHDNLGYGLPNNLQFAVAGLRAGIRYDVTVDGVVVNGTRTRYGYTFSVV